MHALCIYLERLGFYLHMQPKIILNDVQEAKTYPYIGHWKYGRNMAFMDIVFDRTLETIGLKWVYSHTQLLKIWLQIKGTECYNIILPL